MSRRKDAVPEEEDSLPMAEEEAVDEKAKMSAR